ncbi:MAG: DUF4198 domain-containing protein [Gemmataceae bacterium]
MNRFVLLVVLGGAWLGVIGQAQAHDLKVFASRLRVSEVGDWSTVYVAWGHILPVDDLIDAEHLERYDMVPPSGKSQPLKKAGVGLQADEVELTEAGISQVVVARRPAILTYVYDASGRRVMRRGSKTQIKEGKIDSAKRSQQFAKALIVTGSPKGQVAKPLGLPLEIVPLDPADQWRANQELRFQVLVQGRPAAGQTMFGTFVGFTPDDAWCYATSTDAEGVATVRVRRAGTWILKVNVQTPAAESSRAEYDFESLNTTLVFAVEP